MGGDEGVDPLRLGEAGDGDGAAVPDGDVGQRPRLFAVGDVVGDRRVEVVDVDAGRGLPEADQAVGSGNGSGFRRTVLTTLKMAVLAPIPSASVSRVASVNIGVRARRRAAWRTSRIRSNIGFPLTGCLRAGADLVHR